MGKLNSIFVLGICLVIATTGHSNAQQPECRCNCAETGCCLVVRENSAVNSSVGFASNLSSLEMLGQDFTTPRYRIQNSQGLFTVDPVTSEVRTTAMIDREGQDITFNDNDHCITIGIGIVDASTSKTPSFLPFFIDVLDENDNPPMFNQPEFTINIPETTTNNPTLSCPGGAQSDLKATDLDEGVNGMITFSVANGFGSDVFFVPNPTQPCVVNRVDLDRDQSPTNYSFVLVAEDGGNPQMRSNTTVTFVLEDVNDNPPIFEQSFYNLTVREDQEINIPFFRFHVTDIDEGGVQTLMFSLDQISNPNVPFSINESTGELSLSEAVNAEIDERMYQMRVIVSEDVATGPLMSSATVNVYVEDINEQAAISVIREINSLMEEEIMSGNLWLLRLVDGDKDESNKNNTIRIISGEEFFAVQGPNVLGIFSVSQMATIDRERNASVELVLQIIQWGNPVLYDYRNFSIAIMDKNDNAPFLPFESYDFMETEQDNENVLNICDVAQDNDDGNNGMIRSFIFDSVTNENGDDKTSDFEIRNNRTDDCTLYAPPLDREKEGNFLTIAVQLFDNGIPSMNSRDSFVLNLIDINDNYPRFLQNKYKFHVMENQNRNVFVGNVEAIDEDSGQNGNITYMIHPGDYSELFSIDPRTGNVFTNTSFDREQKGSYTINITARDNGSPVKFAGTMAEVTVVIDDDNDNFPVFSQSTVEFHVDTSDNKGTVVGIVEAEDQDIEPNTQIIYQLDNPQQYFMVRNSTGEIVLSEQLPSEEMTYSLTISAYNPGFFEQRSTINVTMTATKSSILSIPLIAGIAGSVFILVVLTLVTILVLLVISYKLHSSNREEASVHVYEEIEDFTPPAEIQKNAAYGCQLQRFPRGLETEV